jgi:hypothetical protein
MTKKRKDLAATGLGIMTSLVMALALIDFDTIDFSKPNDIIKILVILLPAIGGKVSTIKGEQ